MSKKNVKPLPLYKHSPKSLRMYVSRLIGLLDSGWCQQSYARNRNGIAVDCLSPNAASVCLSGAGVRADPDGNYWPCLRDKIRQITDGRIASFNDDAGRKVSEVVALVKRASRSLGAEAK